MNFTIKVKLTASTKLIGAINLLAGGVTLPKPEILTTLVAERIEPAEPVAEKTTRTRKTKEAVKEEEVAEVAEVVEEETTEASNTSVNVEMIRAAVQGKASGGKRDQVKALLTKFGVAKITDVPEAKYSNFLTEINAL